MYSKTGKKGGIMCILLSILILAPVFEPLSLGDLNGNWTVGIRFDNLLEAHNSLNTSVSHYDEDTHTYLSTYQSASLGFPSEYSLLWRFNKTMAIGMRGSVYYYDTPSGRYEQFRYEGDSLLRREEGELIDKHWSGYVGLEIYKYFHANKSLAPYITIFPNYDVRHDRYEEKGIRYEADTVSYSRRNNRDGWNCGVGLNCGVEYFFKLWSVQLGVRAKTALAGISRYYSEYTYSRFEENMEEYRHEREHKGYRINLYLPTQGKSSLWLCCYF